MSDPTYLTIAARICALEQSTTRLERRVRELENEKGTGAGPQIDSGEVATGRNKRKRETADAGMTSTGASRNRLDGKEVGGGSESSGEDRLRVASSKARKLQDIRAAYGMMSDLEYDRFWEAQALNNDTADKGKAKMNPTTTTVASPDDGVEAKRSQALGSIQSWLNTVQQATATAAGETKKAVVSTQRTVQDPIRRPDQNIHPPTRPIEQDKENIRFQFIPWLATQEQQQQHQRELQLQQLQQQLERLRHINRPTSTTFVQPQSVPLAANYNANLGNFNQPPLGYDSRGRWTSNRPFLPPTRLPHVQMGSTSTMTSAPMQTFGGPPQVFRSYMPPHSAPLPPAPAHVQPVGIPLHASRASHPATAILGSGTGSSALSRIRPFDQGVSQGQGQSLGGGNLWGPDGIQGPQHPTSSSHHRSTSQHQGSTNEGGGGATHSTAVTPAPAPAATSSNDRTNAPPTRAAPEFNAGNHNEAKLEFKKEEEAYRPWIHTPQDLSELSSFDLPGLPTSTPQRPAAPKTTEHPTSGLSQPVYPPTAQLPDQGNVTLPVSFEHFWRTEEEREGWGGVLEDEREEGELSFEGLSGHGANKTF